MTDQRQSNLRPRGTQPASSGPGRPSNLRRRVVNGAPVRREATSRRAYIVLTPHAESFDTGDLVELHAVFTDAATGEFVQPDRVTCTVRPARGGNPQTVPVRLVDGFNAAAVIPDAAGTWHFAFDATGGHHAAGESFFYVRAQRVPR